MQRLALFLDGTWNDVDDVTNVSRLHSFLSPNDGSTRQLSLYQAGVGTSKMERLRGGALGVGLGENVTEAYDWLRRHYQDGDEIFIFGFSRGAFTARSVAGMIAKCGLAYQGSSLDTLQLFRRYQLSRTTRPIYELEYAKQNGGKLSPEEEQLLASSRRIKIKMLGVWDTVGALGIPFGNIPGLSRRQFQFHHTRLSNLFECAVQALAIDEHRKAYQPTLWTRFDPKKVDTAPTPLPNLAQVEQRWFPGAHANVGGGCKGRLHELPLSWMQERSRACGLKFTTNFQPAGDAYAAPMSDSYSEFIWGLYKVGTFGKRFFRPILAPTVDKREGIVSTVNETIDESVFRRFQNDPSYRPANLVEWAKRQSLHLEKLSGSLQANNGRPIP